MMDLATKLNPAAWMLAEEGKYQQALDLYSEAKSRGFKLTPPDHANCGKFLLCLEKYEEASAEYRMATELRDMSDRKGEGSYLDSQGVAQWLMGRHHEAVIAWRYRVSGILSGKFTMRTWLEVLRMGCLLWYAAVERSRFAQLHDRLF